MGQLFEWFEVFRDFNRITNWLGQLEESRASQDPGQKTSVEHT
jgi:hypothetical protein